MAVDEAALRELARADVLAFGSVGFASFRRSGEDASWTLKGLMLVVTVGANGNRRGRNWRGGAVAFSLCGWADSALDCLTWTVLEAGRQYRVTPCPAATW